MPAPEIAFLTICTVNHLASVLTLAASLAKVTPRVRLQVFLVDPLPDGVKPGNEHVELVDIAVLRIPGFEEMAFCYDATGLCCALKPYCLDHVLRTLPCDAAIYLDSDILVLSALDHVVAAFQDGAACVLTPHITRPLRDGRLPNEDSFLTTGTFNLGFAAFSKAPSARAFLAWWQGKNRYQCVVDTTAGLLYDQTFCNLAPCFIDDFVCLNHPAYNVAYWNLAQRRISRAGDQFFVDGEQVRFVHFSGLNRTDPTSVSRHQNRFTRSDLGAIAELFDAYVAELDRRDQHATGRYSEVAYGYGCFRNGEAIKASNRSAFRRINGLLPDDMSPFELDAEFFAPPVVPQPRPRSASWLKFAHRHWLRRLRHDRDP